MDRRLLVLVALLGGCGGAAAADTRTTPDPEPAPPLPLLPWETSDTEAESAPPLRTPRVALTGGTVFTATGRVLERGVVVFEDGLLLAVGSADEVTIPEGTEIVDVTGKFVTPGIIDTHSHMGVYPVPELRAHSDGNEATAPVTAEVRAADGFWPQDPALGRALAAGVTTIEVLPGSANLIGGRGVIVKLRPGRSVAEMHFPGAPDTLKMACGENPKRVYGEHDRAPSTRMGNVAGQRAAFQAAIEYGRAWQSWRVEQRQWRIAAARHEREQASGTDDGEGEGPGAEPSPPERDYGLETLLGALEGRILVQAHCYRADDMLALVALSDDLGFRIRSFHHAVEAYKIRDVLAREEIAVSTWADWWGFKVEAFDTIPENLALLQGAGVRAIVHSDSAMLVQRLNQEAAKAMWAGRQSGLEVTEDQAIRWITANPAWALGIQERTGTLEAGKMADVVVWSRSPLSFETRAERVYVDGALLYQRTAGVRPSDFEVGLGVSP